MLSVVVGLVVGRLLVCGECCVCVLYSSVLPHHTHCRNILPIPSPPLPKLLGDCAWGCWGCLPPHVLQFGTVLAPCTRSNLPHFTFALVGNPTPTICPHTPLPFTLQLIVGGGSTPTPFLLPCITIIVFWLWTFGRFWLDTGLTLLT